MRGLVVVEQSSPVRKQCRFAFALLLPFTFLATVLISSCVSTLVIAVILRAWYAAVALRSRLSSIRMYESLPRCQVLSLWAVLPLGVRHKSGSSGCTA